MIAAPACLCGSCVPQEDRSRFVESFKKQFVAQEIESLQKRTAAGANGAPQAECLVRRG